MKKIANLKLTLFALFICSCFSVKANTSTVIPGGPLGSNWLSPTGEQYMEIFDNVGTVLELDENNELHLKFLVRTTLDNFEGFSDIYIEYDLGLGGTLMGPLEANFLPTYDGIHYEHEYYVTLNYSGMCTDINATPDAGNYNGGNHLPGYTSGNGPNPGQYIVVDAYVALVTTSDHGPFFVPYPLEQNAELFNPLSYVVPVDNIYLFDHQKNIQCFGGEGNYVRNGNDDAGGRELNTEDSQDPTASFSVQLSPNPFTDAIQFEYNLEETSDLEIVISTISGKEIFRNQYLSKDQGVHRESIQLVGDIPKGLYIAYVYHQGKAETFKLIKL